MLISKSRAAKKQMGGACPNESYSRARAAVDATSPPAAAALCFHHRRHLRIFFAPPLLSATAVAPSDSPLTVWAPHRAYQFLTTVYLPLLLLSLLLKCYLTLL